MKIGAVSIDIVRDGQVVIPASVQYPGVTAERWEAHRGLLDDDGGVVNAIGGYLIRDGARVILVDLGLGAATIEGWDTGAFLDSLGALDTGVEDVTDVIFTHLHPDHIGWASIDGDITFPNATYRCDARDWPYFMMDYEPEEVGVPEEVLPKNKLAPLTETIVKWSSPGMILPGIEIIDAAGHSPGHCAVRISSRGHSAMLIGDVVHHQVELLESGWPGVFDHDEDRARQSREAIAQLLTQTEVVFTAAHFRNFEWWNVTKTPDGLAWQAIGDSA